MCALGWKRHGMEDENYRTESDGTRRWTVVINIRSHEYVKQSAVKLSNDGNTKEGLLISVPKIRRRTLVLKHLNVPTH
jgi:hypothetical protein